MIKLAYTFAVWLLWAFPRSNVAVYLLIPPIIVSKLPSDIRLHIAREATKEAWKIDDLHTTIKVAIEAREIRECTKSSVNN